MPDSRRSLLIIDDNIPIVCQDEKCRNRRNPTTLDTLIPFSTPRLQPASKRLQNRKQLNLMPSR